ncbi:LysM peptidoglycan-binding domain-containing protein [Mucilaginibacter sp. PAMB04274]|uniref:LysM peptidoglycan-binding domain-containing protein n=1 Tax=Mucilaginibacter sp. PAMB04274 TaxID=3138568 RepID=UPI0031F648CF
MTLKISVLAGVLSLLTAPLIARPLLDSVGVENQDGKKIILHKLEPKDNYFSIGRRYNIKPGVIIQYNNNASLRVGGIIKVPTEQPFVIAGSQQASTGTINQGTANGAVTEYKVSAGETLYAISRRFSVRVEDIISQNNLKSSSLYPGQILQIRAVAAAATPPPVAQTTTTQPAVVTTPPVTAPAVTKRDSILVAKTDTSAVERRLPANRYGLTERNEKGVATYFDDAGLGLDPNKKLVLHQTAPIGTVFKITNPMTNRTTYAKVVGRFTDNQMTKDVIIVLTKSAADALGALDKRFQVNISYGTPSEQQ